MIELTTKVTYTISVKLPEYMDEMNFRKWLTEKGITFFVSIEDEVNKLIFQGSQKTIDEVKDWLRQRKMEFHHRYE